MHHARTQTSTLCGRCVSRANLQTEFGREGTRGSGRNRKTAEAIWLDSRDRLPIRECALRRRIVELARAETCAAPSEIVQECAYPPSPVKIAQSLRKKGLGLVLPSAHSASDAWKAGGGQHSEPFRD